MNIFVPLFTMHPSQSQETIVALATPPGQGAIAVIRLSGKKAFQILDAVFESKSKKKISEQKTHTLHFGQIKNKESLIDEVLVSVFRAPHSYSGDDTAEISCHGSSYIQQQLLDLFSSHGARLAQPGEFTQRAFLNGKLDLSQAEAVADLVASGSEAEHKLAMQQMRGGYSEEMKQLRDRLIHFASLIELELDFAEEDVQFADREQLTGLIDAISGRIDQLLHSFAMGNVIREGIPVAIAGKPNAGKSTLLNAILREERALVSDIPGTTRDTIEEKVVIDGIPFRFIDTAGIRESTDTVERMGVSRTFEKMAGASVIFYVFDPANEAAGALKHQQEELREKYPAAELKFICNKADLYQEAGLLEKYKDLTGLLILSAKESTHLDLIHNSLHEFVSAQKIDFHSTVITNARHAEALRNTLKALQDVREGITSGLTGDLLSIHLRSALHHLGSITGEIATDDLLKNIFSKFCIGK